MGIIQYAYDTDRLTYDYMDMEQQDTGSVSFSVVRDSETVNKITQMPRIKIDTSAKLQSSYQSFQNIYNSWQGIWGNAADYGITSPDDYYYIVWQVRNSVNATQPYTITQNVSVSGTNGAVSVVGARFGNENYSASLTSTMLRLSSENVYTYIITKHLKSAYPSDMSYRIESNVTTVIEPYDGLDSSSSQVTTSFRSYNPPTPVYPIGYFNFWKYNSYSDRKNTGVVNYQLTNFYNNQIDSITSNMNFHMYVHGYAYPWTIEDGYSTTEVSHYGKKKVTYELTDDEFYFNDNISDTSAPSGTEQLDINDFEIMSLKYTLLFQSAEWDERALKFVLCNPEYTSEEKVYFYAKFGEDETWKEIGVYHLDTGLCQIIDREKVQSWNGDSIIFNDDAGCVGFKIVSSNAFYYTRIDAYPYCRIKHSVRIDSMVSEKYRNNEKKSWFTNRANAKVYANDGEEISEENQIFNKTEVATNYLMGYDIESRINKRISFSQNDKLRHFVTLGWKVDLSESYKTQNGKKNVPQSSGAFYDLLPAGSTIDKSTVEVKANNEYLKESRYSVSTVINYKNSGRTLLIVKIDEGTESGYELTYSTIHSWDSIIDFGSRIHNSVAYETGNDSIAKGFPDDGGNIEDSSIMSDLDSDSDSDRFVYAEHNYMMNILVAATNGLSKSVKNHNDYSYSREAVVYQNEQYEYKLRYANSYISVANNLVFYDSLESFSGDEGLASLWRGTLQSVDLSQAVLAGTAPVVYLSGSVLDMNDPDNRNLSDRSKWKPMEEFGDISAARSVAVDLSKNTSGGKFVLKENKSLSVELIMKAPPREPDDIGGTGNSCIQSLNGAYVSGNLINTETGVEEDGRLINWNYTAVELRIASDIPLKKVDESDHTKAVEGISFRLSGESDYGTYVDEIKESGINGYLTFAGIEKGEYTLTEERGSPDYQRITTYFSVKVNGQGEVYVDGQKISDGKRFIIADPPRIHTNVSFTKKDLSNKSKILHGVRFRLYGTSDYNNYVNMYADSDDKGVVEFKGIELGTYTLEEISSIDGYIIDPELHTVIIDENANFSISGSYMEKNGSLTLYNEPLHSFTLKKESYTKTGDVYNPVSGAVFRLHGVSDYGTSVDFQKTTHTNGKAYFTNLEAGKSYIIEEVSAPEGYIKDDEKRIVKIDPDGTITISGIEKNSSGEFVFKNRENGSVTVIKKWIDDKTNETRTAEPVINIGIDHKDPNAYFGDSSSSSVLSNVAALSNIKRFEPYKGDEADVQPLITNGTAKKIDDGTTENSIYAWFDASANGGTVYWWSDAAEVFLLDKSARLFRGLSDVTYIDVSGINTSECKNMSYMFNELKKLETIDGLDTWDVSSVTTMYNMFYNCQALMSLDLRGWDTSNVTSMSQMFYNCNSLTSIEGIDQWDVSKVTSMEYLFYRCYVLPTLDLSGWNVSSVTNMKSMFSSCSSMTSFDSISGWDVSLVKDMSSMFYGCSGITNFDILGGWDVSSVNSLNSVFSYCRNLTEIKGISDWNVSKANQTGYMFRGCEKLETLDLSKWKNKPQYAPNYMFQDCKMLEELDLSGFDFELAQNGMEYMFSGCSSLKKIEGLSNLNIPKVSSIKYMFSDCQNLISLDLSGWNAPNTTIMTNLFYNCKSLKSVDLTGWSFSKTSLEGLFLNCSSLETLDLSSWDTSKVTSTYRMFSNCSSLTTIYASDRWDLSSVTSSNNMFQNCTSLVGGNNTPYSSSNTGKAYAIIDEEGKPGYLTRKDYSPESEITIIELDESGTGTETGTEAEVRRILTKTTDDTWTYLFTGLDPTLNYCVWEDELEGYTSENMGMSNALSVRNNTATITNDSGYVPPCDLIRQP